MEALFIVLRCYSFVEMVSGAGGRNNEPAKRMQSKIIQNTSKKNFIVSRCAM